VFFSVKHFQKDKKYVIIGWYVLKNLIELSLKKGITAKCVPDFNCSKRSTIGTGGKAPYAFYPQSIKELIKLIDFFEEENVPFVAFGRMSNVLPPDGVFDKAVIMTTKLTGIEFTKNVFCEAGTTVGAFLRACGEHSKTGAEFLAGIPCTIGGALYMNAGVKGNYISDIVKKVLVYRQGKLSILPKKACGYGYKKSIFMEDGSIILGAELALEDGEKGQIEETIKDVLRSRTCLPRGKSMGCIFKNPLGDSAGRLIEGAGLKGLRIGGASVSTVHANFIINDGNATSEEIKKLILIIKNAVYAQYKIGLEEEIRIIE